MAFVELKDVRKSYHMGEITIHAVDGISFTIEKGEFVVIVGPSGAGKHISSCHFLSNDGAAIQ